MRAMGAVRWAWVPRARRPLRPGWDSRGAGYWGEAAVGTSTTDGEFLASWTARSCEEQAAEWVL